MKFLLLVVAVLSAGVNATPQDGQGRIIEGIISGILDDLINDIQEAGLDPLQVDQETYIYKLPVTDLLIATAAVEDLLVEGLSNIVLHNINFSIIFSRLRFDISLPQLSAVTGPINGNVQFASLQGDGSLSGSLKIVGTRLSGEAFIDGILGAITGGDVSIRSLTVNFRIQDIQSNQNVVLMGQDISTLVNGALNHVIPTFLVNYSNEVNELLAYFIVRIANDLLDN